ncbi:antimicrobial peptide NK-lysin-like [Anguilla rostrata]|uniref:antimicrobial peptide NK-lysin-like n=1 Tax=Anguilla rostrata TaxID=7938 RepID=UPI0030D16767
MAVSHNGIAVKITCENDMKMKSPIILCFLLAYAACAQSGHFHGEGFSETEDDLALQTEMERTQKIPGTCFICKRIVEKVKRTISNDASKQEIVEKLHRVCEILPVIKASCKRLVSKYIDKLATELAAGDDVRTACVKIKLCRPKVLWE